MADETTYIYNFGTEVCLYIVHILLTGQVKKMSLIDNGVMVVIASGGWQLRRLISLGSFLSVWSILKFHHRQDKS